MSGSGFFCVCGHHSWDHDRVLDTDTDEIHYPCPVSGCECVELQSETSL